MAATIAQDVHARAQEALTASPVFALRALRVDHVDATLVISGAVASFYHKQLAQEAVRVVADGTEVVNSIEVRGSAE